MAKFKVNQKVIRNSDNAIGTVMAKEVVADGKSTVVNYLVNFGGGMKNWQIVSRKDISRLPNKRPSSNTEVKMYKLDDGKVLTIVAKVSVESTFDEDGLDLYKVKYKALSLGFSIYNGIDEYDEAVGIKIAMHRCKNNPFTRMISPFSGEFSKETVMNIIESKAKYIIENIDKFYRPQ